MYSYVSGFKGHNNSVELDGTVTYIHPSKRWYQVTFDNGIKECFFFDVEPIKLAVDRKTHNGEW